MRVRAILSVIILSVMAACVSGTAPTTTVDAGPFPAQSAAESMTAVDTAMAAAKANSKRVLVVMGGNWCHDSKALMEKLEDPALAPIMADGYEVALVNVGFLDNGFDITERFLGHSVYTHTPTVLVIDPEEEVVVNRHAHQRWRDAYKLPVPEMVAILVEMMSAPAVDRYASFTEAPAMQTIDEFEAAQHERIKRGYTRVGPKLAARAADLDDDWYPLAELRYALPDDAEALRLAVARRIRRGEPVEAVEVHLPVYDLLPWEADGAVAAN